MRNLSAFILLATALSSSAVYAGGVGLGATRMIYSATATRSALDIRNTSKDSSFLIQSWVENEIGSR